MTGSGLEVINAGFSKTGTKTMNTALTILGYNVCDAPEAGYRHYREWWKIQNGEEPRKVLRKMFDKNNQWGYTAVVDLPHNIFWDVLSDEFPEAKVILVLRDEDKWAASLERHLQVERAQFKEMGWWRLHRTIYSWIFNHSCQTMEVYMDWMRPLLMGPEARNYYGTNMDVHIQKFRQHNLYVMNTCPKEKLLVWRLTDGWEPLCKFLGKPVPNQPLPHENRLGGVIQELAESVDYQKMVRKQTISIVVRLSILIVVGIGWYRGIIQPYLNNEHGDRSWCSMFGAFIGLLFAMKNI